MLQSYFKCLIIILMTFGCQAPHSNPLDPDNPNTPLRNIEGYVLTYSLPHQPLNDVEVYFPAQNRVLYTDANGYFEISQLRVHSGWLFFDKSGYHVDSLQINAKTGREALQVYLNAAPAIDSLIFYSTILNRFPDLQILRLTVEAAVSDPDNDVDTVFFNNPLTGRFHPLSYNIPARLYQQTLSMSELGIDSPEAVIGHTFYLYVWDKFERMIRLTGASIERIIKEQIVLDSPGSHTIVSSTPTLKWQPLQVGFPFQYVLQIYTDEIDPQLVWEKRNLAPATFSYKVDEPLPSGDYFWVAWCIDEFQNRSRSKPKSFQVE